MTEHETNEQGACPDCKSPSYAGHTPDCPANKQNTKRLHFTEAEEEAFEIRSHAVKSKAIRDLGERRTEDDYQKAVWMDGMSGAEYTAEELHRKRLDDYKQDIHDYKINQPSKQDYDKGEKYAERIKER